MPIFCAQSWIFLSSVSTEKNPRGSQAVNDRFSTGSSKQKKHPGVAGSVKTAPCVFSLLIFYEHPFPLLAPCSWCAEERCILGFLRFLRSTFSGPFNSSRELHTLEPTSFRRHSPHWMLRNQVWPSFAESRSKMKWTWLLWAVVWNGKKSLTRDGSIYCRRPRFSSTFITGAVQRVSQEPG